MVRVGSRVVIGRMTTKACGGCIIVIAIVTGITIIGNSSMSPIQRPIAIVNRKGRRLPVRRRGMAHGTICRDVQRHVVGIGALVIIRTMAAVTGVGGI